MNDLQVIGSKINTLPDRPPFMLDKDLSMIYGTTTKRINQAVKRNQDRFPKDFIFQLTENEAASCGFDEVVTDCDHIQNQKFRRKDNLPFGFTREGCNMLSAVLTTPTAVARSVQIMRAFSNMERGVNATTGTLERVVNVVADMGKGMGLINERLSALESQPSALDNRAHKKTKRSPISWEVEEQVHNFDGELFISAIEGLIASRKSKIIRDLCEDKYIDQGTTIGFVKEMYPRFVYLFPKTTLEILRKYYRLEEHRFLFFSSAVIAKQLMADGYVVRPSKNSRFLVRIPGGGRGTTPKRVWKLYAEKFTWSL